MKKIDIINYNLEQIMISILIGMLIKFFVGRGFGEVVKEGQKVIRKGIMEEVVFELGFERWEVF